MTTSADEPTRPTVPNRSDAPTLTPGELSQHSDATRATVPANRPGLSDTRPTIPAIVSGSAPTQVLSPSGMSATAATVKSGEDLMTRPPPASPTGAYDGQTWGDFKLGKMLGRGGMGAVYAGKQMSLDRPVAIKVLIGHLADNEDFRKRFLLEARAAARINSPHVVQVYYAGTHSDLDFFAMEYVEGTDIARRLKDGWQPTPPECLELIFQATRSLVALGEHKIVHRDIKPANYMLTTAGVVKLMDFGLVKFASEAHGLTQTGTVMGTVNYFSPEQGRGEVCDQRTDIYALGVMFYELLTGKLPFTGGDATSVIYQHIHTEPKPPKIHNPSVTEPYQSVVLKCLAKDPKNRYQSAKELLDDLERIVRGEVPLAGKSKKTGGTAGGQATARKLTLAAAVIIAAVILGLAIMLRPTTAVSLATAATTPTPIIPMTIMTKPTVAATPPSQPITAPMTSTKPAVITPIVVTTVTPTTTPMMNAAPAKPIKT
ncbi:MAG TPA: serine/threonine-protein kinase, partial [Planctomycetota bacterium]|nr:serine/threonine-protein kinase [Planctomycetota bacterium]